MQPTLSVASFVLFGWETFKKRPWFFIGIYLIPIPFSIIFGFVVGIVGGILTFAGFTSASKIIVLNVSWAAQFLIMVGTYAIFLKAHDSLETAQFRDLWHPRGVIRFTGVFLLFTIISIVGLVLFIVPGIVAMLTFSMAPLLTIDKGLGPIAALKESARIMKGQRMRLLALGGATFLVSLLGVLALIVGVTVALPVVMLAAVRAYRQFQLAADQHTPKQPLSKGEIILLIVGLVSLVISYASILNLGLGALNTAREQGHEAVTVTNLKLLQLGLEDYHRNNGDTYPDSIEELMRVFNEQSSDASRKMSPEDFTYTPQHDYRAYVLCAKNPVPDEENQCVSSGDANVTFLENE